MRKNIFSWVNFFLIMILLGGMLNIVATIYNDCKMPVLAPSWNGTNEYKTFFAIKNTENIENEYLIDRYKIGTYYLSIGDFIMFGSSFLMIFILMYDIIISLINHHRIKRMINFKKKNRGRKGWLEIIFDYLW